jgi:hypothetical protein
MLPRPEFLGRDGTGGRLVRHVSILIVIAACRLHSWLPPPVRELLEQTGIGLWRSCRWSVLP